MKKKIEIDKIVELCQDDEFLKEVAEYWSSSNANPDERYILNDLYRVIMYALYLKTGENYWKE